VKSFRNHLLALLALCAIALPGSAFAESGYVVNRSKDTVVIAATAAATRTLTSKDCGKAYILLSAGATDHQTFNLPKAKVGCQFTFVNIIGTAQVNVNPIDGDTISIVTDTVDDSAQTTTAASSLTIVGVNAAAAGVWYPRFPATGTWADAN